MRMFVRATLAIAVVLVALFVLVFILKLLVVAALIAAVVVGGALLFRIVALRLGSRNAARLRIRRYR